MSDNSPPPPPDPYRPAGADPGGYYQQPPAAGPGPYLQPPAGSGPYPGAPGAYPGAYPATYPYATSAATAPLSSPARALGWVLLGCGVLVAVSAFLPWVTGFGVSVNGIGGDDVGGAKDGVLTLPLGLLVAVSGLLRGVGAGRGGWQLAWAIIALVLSALVALIAVVDISDISGIGFVSVGAGLVLTLLFGLAGIAIGIAAIVKRH